jgi:SSS family solute:Na+ symporter
LYFKWGTTAGAWVAMTIGWVMAVGSIIIRQIAPLFKDITDRGPLLSTMDWLNSINSQYVWFWTMLSCLLGYLLVSLLTYRQPFNLHKMLHRNKYDTVKDHVKVKDSSKSVWRKFIGITDEFTKSDRIFAIMAIVWHFSMFSIFAVGTVIMFTVNLSDDTCSRFWQVWAWVYLSIGIPAMIWFTWGGIRDIRRFFARLSTMKRDERDDGRVVDHHGVVDEDT